MSKNENEKYYVPENDKIENSQFSCYFRSAHIEVKAEWKQTVINTKTIQEKCFWSDF